MPLCCWLCRCPTCGGGGSGTDDNETTISPIKIKADKTAKTKPPTIKVSEAPEYGNGNPRNKCALQPGHSLMDWIRFGNSGKDLSGVGGRLRAVTPNELAQHNQQGNAWIAIRGRVYNVTDYMDYHPGGPEELMRGVGKDATKLFDQIHAWVNYESLLSKCLVGPLKTSQISDEDLKKILFEGYKDSPKKNDKPVEVFRKSTESLKSSTKSAATGNDTVNKSSSESSLNMNSDKTSNSEPTVKDVDESVFKYPKLTLTHTEAENPIKVETPPEQKIPKFDWIQKTDSLTLIFYTKPFANPECMVYLPKDKERWVNIELTYDFHTYFFHILLEAEIKWPCYVGINYETGKIDIHLNKEKSKIWKTFGKIVDKGVSEQSIQINTNNIQCAVLDKIPVTHNTSLVIVKFVDKKYISLPVGYHVRVFSSLEDEMSRSYTPVPPYLIPDHKPEKWTTDAICLMVKKYEQGIVSSWLTSRSPEDEITISKPLGSFSLKMLQDVTQLWLIGAGTGITPLLSVGQFVLQRRNPRCKRIDLLFYNRTEKDILWHDQLSTLATKDDRFHLTNTLSEGSSSWNGQRGHINQATLINLLAKVYCTEIYENGSTENLVAKKEMLENVFEDNAKEIFFCVCGPTSFTKLTSTLLVGLGCQANQMHCFLG